jgi:ribose/xylose/arabinose/galactoside ABC-type transport system permease subunit
MLGVVSGVKKNTGILPSIMKVFQSQQAGLVLIIVLLGAVLTVFAGSHVDPLSGKIINNFLNPNTLLQTMTDASFFAIMAVGMTAVVISSGIDLSVGSIFALSGVATAIALRAMGAQSPAVTLLLGLAICLSIGLLCGIINGSLVVGLKVHPFIITLGFMWVLRGIAFVSSKAESILMPDSLTRIIKSPLGLGKMLSPIPMLMMLLVAVVGAIYLQKTVAGRHVFAVGGNEDASRYAGLRINRVLIGVYALSGLTAGLAAFLGASYYGSASCIDATGYELFVIASAVVGGASLSGGKGNAISAMLGAILIVLIRQSIRSLHFDQQYEWIIIGFATIIAVVIDQTSARLSAKRLVRAVDSAEKCEPESEVKKA